jgi:hypothetical protein
MDTARRLGGSSARRRPLRLVGLSPDAAAMAAIARGAVCLWGNWVLRVGSKGHPSFLLPFCLLSLGWWASPAPPQVATPSGPIPFLLRPGAIG